MSDIFEIVSGSGNQIQSLGWVGECSHILRENEQETLIPTFTGLFDPCNDYCSESTVLPGLQEAVNTIISGLS